MPQAWFSHFYALGALCNAASLAALAAAPLAFPHAPVALSGQRWGTAVAVLLQLHLLRRLAETLLVMRYPAGARMHAVAYAFGMRHVCMHVGKVLKEKRGANDWGTTVGGVR